MGNKPTPEERKDGDGKTEKNLRTPKSQNMGNLGAQ
jgi:hypothetical protein